MTFVALSFMAAIGILSAIAWDLNSHEYHRVKIQQIADRAVLAAADLDQTIDPQLVVEDYFDKSGYGDVVANVGVEEGLNFRTVSVTVEGLIETTFLGGDFYGAALLGGNAKSDSDAAAQERFDAGRPEDAGKTLEDLTNEELANRTVGDDTTIADAQAVASQNADARIAARDAALAARDAENLERAENGLPPNNRAVKDQFLSNQEILDAEFFQATKDNGPYLRMAAFSEAEERVNNVEISMVLDISGSMSEGDKIRNLRDASQVFVDAVINPSTEDLVSISVVPYAEHVSAGEAIMNEFDVRQVHNYSHCIDFDNSDFSVTTLGLNANGTPRSYDQMQHFFQGTFQNNRNVRDIPACRFGEDDDIVAFSQDTFALKQKMARLTPNGNTSIFLGMKWAAGLLDPSFQPANARLADGGHTDAAFADRPAAFDDSETLKTIILMTDGQNTSSRRINPQVYANPSHYAHWNANNFDWYLRNFVSFNNRQFWSSTRYNTEIGDQLLDNICDVAKEQNIVIWSIGFEVDDRSAGVMRNCASSPSHFFRVEGVEIREAFSAIARQINQLRLTQ